MPIEYHIDNRLILWEIGRGLSSDSYRWSAGFSLPRLNGLSPVMNPDFSQNSVSDPSTMLYE